METDKVAVIGFYVSKNFLSQASTEKIKAYISNKEEIYGRILFTLFDYLTKYTKKFHRISFCFTDEVNDLLPNGTLTGIIGKVNRSEIDIGFEPFIMDDVSTEMVDFSYPFKLYSTTFLTQKPEYKPQIFGIFQTFSLPLWIAIISILFAMSFVYYATYKRRYSFDKILLHTFAVLLRQSAILNVSSMIEKLLVFSWVVGAMFLCLAYDSVFLSFLAFPPVTSIKDVPQLAMAVKKGLYQCVAPPQTAIFELLLKSKNENLRTIGRDLKTNNLSKEKTFRDFLQGNSMQGLAVIVNTDVVDILSVGKIFVSEDRSLESMAAITVRKDFCCKKWLEKFAHRFMAAGLYFKYENDAAFLSRMPRLLKYEEKDTSKRKLALTDVAPAFIFLVFGHIISIFVLMAEVFSNPIRKNKKRRMRIACKEDSMK